MAIKYECDQCGEVKNPADMYGPGVVPHLRPFTYSVNGVCIEVTPHKGNVEDHVCGACLGHSLRTMVDEVWPVTYPQNLEDTLRHIIFEAVGEASACWEHLDKAGTFQDDEATRVGEGLLRKIKQLVPHIVQDHPQMILHSDGITHLATEKAIEECPICQAELQVVGTWEASHLELSPGSDSSGSDVREVRSEPEVQRTGPDVYYSPGTGEKCKSCHGLLINAALASCEQPEYHPDPPRRFRDDPQA